MSARAPYPVAARALLRDTLLDAAGELMRDRPWSAVTMAEIARGAGVSRQTLYNEFGDRRGVAQAYVLREGERFLDAVEQAVVAHRDDPRAALRSALDVFFAAAADHPLVRAIAGGDGSDELLALVTTEGTPLVTFATGRLERALLETFPGVRPADVRALADAVVRLAISHAALPTEPSARTAASISRLLEPFLREALERRAGRTRDAA